MEKLSSAQLERIYLHLLSASPNDSLQSELLDHLACQLEQAMERGQSFEAAWRKVLEEANTKAVQDLKNRYQQELSRDGDAHEPDSLNDIVFEYRNKSYGAYPLRQAYPTTVLNALMAVMGLFLLLVFGLYVTTSSLY
jgi:hypothetical protein